MVNVFMLMRGAVHRLCRQIKIMKPDGTVIKLSGPVYAKEILVDYPNHRIFEAAAFGAGLGIGSLPLPEKAGLAAGHLYYLISLPLPHHEILNYNNREHFARASSRLQPPSFAGTDTDSRKQQEEEADNHVVNKMNRGGVRIVSSSYSTDGSTLRVKLRLRKEEVASFFSTNNVNAVLGNVLVSPSFQDASRQSPWKPRLDTIAETDSPLGD